MNLKYIYTPGAGVMPKYLAGREYQISVAKDAFEALSEGEVPSCIAYSGYRGVGKTVLLNSLQNISLEYGIIGFHIEVREDGNLIVRILDHCRDYLNDNSGTERLKSAFQKGLNALQSLEIGFSPDSKTFSLSAKNDIIQNRSDYSQSLENLFEAIGPIAREKKQPVCFFIDEFQYAQLNEMDAFLGALHRVSQLSYPIMAIVAGTPEMIVKMYERKTYVERLFDFPDLMMLNKEDVAEALSIPGENIGLSYDSSAIEFIFQITGGYPYFVQLFGKIICNDLSNNDLPFVVSKEFVESKEAEYLRQLDNNFYKIRYNNRSKSEQFFLQAMAGIPLPCTLNDIAKILDKTNKQLAPTLAKLKAKGIVSSDNGLNFTVPGFTDYLKRQRL